MEFVDNAAKLELYTYQHCGRFPKRYRFTLETEIIKCASDVYTNVSKANDYPVSISHYENRIKLYYESRAILETMVRKLRIADEIFGINKNVLREWMGLIEREIRLLGGIASSDKEAIKTLKSMNPNLREETFSNNF